MNKIAIGFLGHIFFDTRTFNLFNTLKDKGHDVTFIGFDWLTKDFQSIDQEEITVTKLHKSRISILFYLRFFLLQIKAYLKTNVDIYFAGDFFSLPASVIAAKIKRAKVYYDSREIYSELPSLEKREKLKKFFKIIERIFIKQTDCVFTTGEMDSEYIEKLYSLKQTYLLRNLPLMKKNISPINYQTEFNIPSNKLIILYQGIIVEGRGIETYLKAVKKADNLYLVILGGGEHIEKFKLLSEEMKINDRVFFAGKISQDKLLDYTAGAFAGLSLIDDISINNHYALPNKLFEYVMSGLPVIVSNLPQMKKIVLEYDIGEVIKESNEDELIEVLIKWTNDQSLYKTKKENCVKASVTLNWGTEFENIYYLFR
jgi:glycosyltransferase involved in cell wall biosynthesis